MHNVNIILPHFTQRLERKTYPHIWEGGERGRRTCNQLKNSRKTKLKWISSTPIHIYEWVKKNLADETVEKMELLLREFVQSFTIASNDENRGQKCAIFTNHESNFRIIRFCGFLSQPETKSYCDYFSSSK